MNDQPLSTLHDYQLTNNDQDVRGWPVKDAAGKLLGTVRELLVDTDAEHVSMLVLDNGTKLSAGNVTLADRTVLVGAPRAAGAQSTVATHADEQVISLAEERIKVGKRVVERGAVHVATQVVTTPVEENVRLREENVTVERHAVDRPVTAGDTAFQARTVDMTAMGEDVVVQKTARVVEEIVVRKDARERSETVHDTVRHTEVVVDDGMTAHDGAHRQHFASTYGKTGATYDQYAPAYRFGSTMHEDKRFAGKDWATVEPQARDAWEQKNPGTWEHFKDAVSHAWTKVTGS